MQTGGLQTYRLCDGLAEDGGRLVDRGLEKYLSPPVLRSHWIGDRVLPDLISDWLHDRHQPLVPDFDVSPRLGSVPDRELDLYPSTPAAR